LSALHFVHAVFHQHPRDATQPFLPLIIPVIVKFCRDDWYKVTTGSLKMLEELMVVARPQTDSMDVVSSSNELSSFIPMIYQIILQRLEPVDLDQEIKESAISCTSQFLCTFGSDLTQDHRDTLVSLLHKRLENEPSRISALKAFSLISQSNVSLNISQQLNAVVGDVAAYLKIQHHYSPYTPRNALLGDAIALSHSSSQTVCCLCSSSLLCLLLCPCSSVIIETEE
jgi:cullin-associated NEDD8-dissociated protein 1